MSLTALSSASRSIGAAHSHTRNADRLNLVVTCSSRKALESNIQLSRRSAIAHGALISSLIAVAPAFAAKSNSLPAAQKSYGPSLTNTQLLEARKRERKEAMKAKMQKTIETGKYSL